MLSHRCTSFSEFLIIYLHSFLLLTSLVPFLPLNFAPFSLCFSFSPVYHLTFYFPVIFPFITPLLHLAICVNVQQA